jgi:VWFA-related protein
MKSRAGILMLGAGLWVGAANSQPADRPAQPAGEEPVVRARAEAVLLDLVVRDKDGRPVRDLRPEEIEVLDNQEPQTIISFEFHGESGIDVVPVAEGRSAGGPVRLESTLTPDSSLRMANLVTFVFDNLGVESANLARRAAESFIDRYAGPNTWMAVFNVARRLIVLQEFTQDTAQLKAALVEATSQSPVQYYQKSDEIYARMQEASRLTEQAAAAAASGGPGAAASGPLLAQAKFAELIVNMLQLTRTLDEESQGRSSLYGLLSLVQGQGALEGRKTLIYFSEGLRVMPAVEAIFNTVIGEANRKNVSIYAVDARGLISTGQMDKAREMLEGAVDASRQQQQAGSRPVTREQAMLADRQDEIGRLNPQAGLNDLAVSTGGMLIANTNDFAPGMSKVAEDIYAHYELAYSPRNLVYDGSFRPIQVRVKRPGVTVQTRSGYMALPVTGSPALLPFERNMLSVLAAPQLPADLRLRHGILRFDASGSRVAHTLIVEMPLADLAFREDKKQKQYEADFALLALVKDEQGKVVEKLSQSYPVRGPLKNLEAVRRGDVVFLRRLELPPGRYTLESVAHDQGASRFAARRSEFEVPAPASGVRLSSVVVVKQAEELAEDQVAADDPLYFQNTKIVPSLGEPVVKTEDNKLVLFMTIYPDPSLPYEPRLGIEFSHQGTVLGATQPQLPDRDAKGRIPFFITFPMKLFPLGEHRVRAVVVQGNTSDESVAHFTVTER